VSRRSPRPAAARVAGLTAAALLGVAGCSSSGSAPSGSSFPVGDGVVTMIAPQQRQEPVAMAGTTLAGERLDLASLRGRTVVLNVWGSWCPPCRQEATTLESAYQRLSGRGVAFVGVDTRDDTAQAKAYQDRYGITYPSLVDTGGLMLALRGAVAPSSIPSTLVIDPQGRVAARVSGPVTSTDTLVDMVDDVISGGTGTASP